MNELFGIAASVLTVLSYLLYFRGILFHGTVPHAVSWFVWGLFASIAFVGQWIGHGGAGAWPTGIGALCAFSVAAFGFRRGKSDIRALDIFCLAAALIAIIVWKFSEQPLFAVITVSFADFSAMFPTIRKAWHKPNQETVSTFALTALRHMLSIIALEERSLLTALYPCTLIVSNVSFVALTLIARRRTQKAP